MYNFSQTAVKLLRDYKAVIKKQFPAKESEQRLAELQLNKRLPTKESALYALLERIVKKNNEADVVPQSRLRYCGTRHLMQHIKKVLDLYHVENKRVVNSAQLASRAMIDAIQLMSLPESRRTEEVASKLHDCSIAIAGNGTQEQKNIFINSLRSHAARDPGFFSPLLNHFGGSAVRHNCCANEGATITQEMA